MARKDALAPTGLAAGTGIEKPVNKEVSSELVMPSNRVCDPLSFTSMLFGCCIKCRTNRITYALLVMLWKKRSI